MEASPNFYGSKSTSTNLHGNFHGSRSTSIDVRGSSMEVNLLSWWKFRWKLVEIPMEVDRKSETMWTQQEAHATTIFSVIHYSTYYKVY